MNQVSHIMGQEMARSSAVYWHLFEHSGQKVDQDSLESIDSFTHAPEGRACNYGVYGNMSVVDEEVHRGEATHTVALNKARNATLYLLQH
jgi:hypothetical protein